MSQTMVGARRMTQGSVIQCLTSISQCLAMYILREEEMGGTEACQSFN